MKEGRIVFKQYCKETNSDLKLMKHHGLERVEVIVLSKFKKSELQYYENVFQKYSNNVKNTWKGIYLKLHRTYNLLTLIKRSITNKTSII